MSIKLKHCLTSHATSFNPQSRGFDIAGQFDSLVQPIFPIGMPKLSIYLAFEGLNRDTNFEMRINSPSDELLSSGELPVPRDMFGHGRKVINIEQFVIAERGTYTLDILEKTPSGLKFLMTETLFTTSYPPKRHFQDGEVEAILASKEKIIRTIKSDFKPVDVDTVVKLQLSLDVNEKLEEGHILFPENNILTIEDNEYDLTGLRREMEWMFGRPIPQQQPQNEEGSAEETK
ncbi:MULTISPECIES: hypothetical protein [Psychrilyobacter]|uniref:Uncharacterized protein n=1 Tax=Psychrilyobacter piezotolerans TaxID=2293438 RepID=A0ABX9KLH5_9FUSO|nr:MULTISPECIES: hypothetical protein [Psychrilyobacter]MCS5422623.1 hypothetical protein [Psychrilyobacter sp. S5]NDI76475.1 hypothetical protein [Psychrilyobacter piezotolerans]RDE66069.1 hypothetical protein DV867_00915 [Psychrilyobacter sp. S5]REI43247.1 hypothetical protein DYH56_00915 [Psychrilyobacter piezotolerans]